MQFVLYPSSFAQVRLNRAAAAVVERLEGRTLLSASPLSISEVAIPGGLELKVLGSAGNDRISVTQFDSGLVVSNGATNATYSGSYKNLLIDAGAGNDLVTVDPSVTLDAMLYGGVGNDTLVGGSGNDRLYAGAGKNNLNGGAGDDVLVSIGSTSDTLAGSSGRDSFWTDSTNAERVTDLSADESAGGSLHRVNGFSSSGGAPTKVVKALPVRNLPDPQASAGTTYHNFSSQPLFADAGPSENDIYQGNTGDCYFLATLSSVAKIDPWRIRQSVVDLGDGTYLVQFTRNTTKSFIRVDGDLPTWSDGQLAYADKGAEGSIWVAIMEKAFTYYHSSTPTYDSISGGWMDEVYTALGTTSRSWYSAASGRDLLTLMQSELSAGKSVTWAAGTPTAGSPLLDDHAYTVDHVNTDASGTVVSVTLRNPWGVDGAGHDGLDDGYVTVTGNVALSSMIGLCSARV